MDLLEKDKVLRDEIKATSEYQESTNYVKGYFTDIDIINNNYEFLEVYRYIQYWKLEYRQSMIDYASQPNYAPKSLISNMSLTGEDSYFNFFKNLIENAEYKPSENELVKELVTDYSSLVYLNRADLVDELFNNGIPFKDIYSDTMNGNATLEVVKRMLELDYCPDDSVIMWYISQGFGKLIEIMIPYAYDTDFIFTEIPVDLDTYQVMLETINEGRDISDEKAELILNRMVSDPTFDYLKIDVALFLKLYRKSQYKMSAEYKKILLKIVVEKNQPFLTYSLLKEFDNENKSEIDGVKLSPILLNNFIMDNIQDARTYIIFYIQILNRKNYDVIYDVAHDIEPDIEIQNKYEINSVDYANMQNENFGGDSSDDEVFISKEYSDYQKLYHHENSCQVDENDEIDLISAIGNMSLYKIVDPESRGNTEQVEYVRKIWNDDDSDEE